MIINSCQWVGARARVNEQWRLAGAGVAVEPRSLALLGMTIKNTRDESSRYSEWVLQLGAKHGDYVVGGYYAYKFAVLVDYGEGDQVVFVEEFGDFVVASFFVGEDQRFLG
jgi:hypothetical protein